MIYIPYIFLNEWGVHLVILLFSWQQIK